MLKKTSVALLAFACMSVALVGCSEKVETIPTSQTEAPIDLGIYVPDVTGDDLDTAVSTLEEKGFVVEYDKTLSEGTEWVVSEQSLAALEKVRPGTEITLTAMEKNEYLNVNPDDWATKTSTGLTLKTASNACVDRGLEQFPAGFEVDWKSDKITETVEGENALLVYIADATNADGTATRYVVNCTVTGTEAAPELTVYDLKPTFR